MASGSQNMTTYNARTVTGSNSAASPAGALLLSGAGRASDATGDTWIFLDSLGGTSAPWGIKHDQANNKIHIYGNNTDSVWTRMDTGDTYILGKVGIGYDPETSENLYKLYVNGTSLYTGRLYGNTDNGLEVQSLNTGNWKEGIRIYNASDNYSVLCLCNNDLSDLLSLVHSGSAHSYYIDIENDGTYSKIDIPSKHSGTMALTDGYGASGTWGISITGSARYIQSPDTRSTNPAPSTFNATNGVSFDFKQGSVIGLTSANYSGVMSYRPYASGTDWSGGNAHQIAFNNAGLYWRQGGSSWGNWTQIVTNSGTWSISINGRLTDSAHSWTATEVYNYMTARVLKAGDTMTGQLYINYDQDVGLNQNGSLIIGTKGGGNIGIDGNEIMARSNSAASTLYLNSEGGNVYIGSGGVTSVGTITSSAGYLRSTCNGNTVTIGSQNTSFTHISNSANRPFWFSHDIQMEKGKIIGGAGTQYRPYQLYLGRNSTAASNGINSANPLIEFSNADRSQYGQLVYTDFDSVRSPDGLTWVGNQANSWFQAPRIFGAVWNDYAEYRETKDKIQPGRCVVETGYGDLILSTARLQPGCEIVSDTFGFAIGETDKCKTPTACAGRVLAYLYEDKSLAKPGDPVCSGPNGTVSIMTHEEEIQWPSRIIATISEIPDYEEWEYGSADEFGNKEKLKVDGRIWIRVR